MADEYLSIYTRIVQIGKKHKVVKVINKKLFCVELVIAHLFWKKHFSTRLLVFLKKNEVSIFDQLIN